MNTLYTISIALIIGAAIGSGAVLGVQTLQPAEQQYTKVMYGGPEVTITAQNCTEESCDLHVEVTEWHAIDVLAVERNYSADPVYLTPSNPSTTFEDVPNETENGTYGGIATYLPITGSHGKESYQQHRAVNIREEPKHVISTFVEVYERQDDWHVYDVAANESQLEEAGFR